MIKIFDRCLVKKDLNYIKAMTPITCKEIVDKTVIAYYRDIEDYKTIGIPIDNVIPIGEHIEEIHYKDVLNPIFHQGQKHIANCDSKEKFIGTIIRIHLNENEQKDEIVFQFEDGKIVTFLMENFKEQFSPLSDNMIPDLIENLNKPIEYIKVDKRINEGSINKTEEFTKPDQQIDNAKEIVNFNFDSLDLTIDNRKVYLSIELDKIDESIESLKNFSKFLKTLKEGNTWIKKKNF